VRILSSPPLAKNAKKGTAGTLLEGYLEQLREKNGKKIIFFIGSKKDSFPNDIRTQFMLRLIMICCFLVLLLLLLLNSKQN